MDPQITAALIGAGATIIAAVMTIAVMNRGQRPPSPIDHDRADVPSAVTHRREPPLWWQQVKSQVREFVDDPLGNAIEMGVKLMTLGIGLAICIYMAKLGFQIVRNVLGM